MNFNEFNIPSTPVRKKRSPPRAVPAQVNTTSAPVPEKTIMPKPVTAPSQFVAEESGTGMNIFDFGKNDFVKGIILSEILGKPRSKRRFGR